MEMCTQRSTVEHMEHQITNVLDKIPLNRFLLLVDSPVAVLSQHPTSLVFRLFPCPIPSTIYYITVAYNKKSLQFFMKVDPFPPKKRRVQTQKISLRLSHRPQSSGLTFLDKNIIRTLVFAIPIKNENLQLTSDKPWFLASFTENHYLTCN